jgi:light-regulated signal transduction histidine kinase (bacteriophytochrome)
MDTVQEMRTEFAAERAVQDQVRVQPGALLLELSLDWIVLRASENAQQLLSESHVTLIGEPLGKFVRSQPLHDLRNLFSRLSGTIGIARAYRIRLIDEPDLFDIAFQVSDGRVILEAVPMPAEGLGEAFGTVGGLISGLAHSRGQALLDGGARRMRALTGYDRVTLTCGDHSAESSRGAFPGPARTIADLPPIVADSEASGVSIFPREPDETSASAALLRAPSEAIVQELRAQGVRSSLCVPLMLNGESVGEFRCDCRTARPANFEIHAAAELFAQLFAMRLEIDELKTGA